MDSPFDFKSLQERISSALVKTTRTAGQISAEDLSFQRSLNPAVASLLDEQNARLLGLSNSLLAAAASGSGVQAPRLRDVETVDNNWQGVVEVVDNLLEKADMCLDEYTGVIKRLSPSGHEQAAPQKKKPKSKLSNALRTQNIAKPQLLFEDLPNNEEAGPFRPLLRSKPHAVLPLDQSLTTFVDENGLVQYKHPYENEILQYTYPEATYVKSEPIHFPPFDSTTATLVDTPEAVSAMLSELRGAKEIAIDLEHHDARTYVGLVSLMQISTRDKDWIVDTLKPWRQELQVLNEVFADPSILKVLHGAHMDIVWLQRDLGLYIVGLFDTYHAARTLGYPQASLASLLSRFVDFDANKQYQMADWRIRPLPEEMFNYARSDTHFLLYIYDNMRNQLVELSTAAENRIDTVLRKSKETALQRYERFVYDEVRGTGALGWFNMLSKTPALFSKEQFAVFRAVHRWRDAVAREEDESLNYVMSRQTIFNIAREMPTESATLLSLSHPISPPLRRRLDELLGLIRAAKKTGAEEPSMSEILQYQTDTRNNGVPDGKEETASEPISSRASIPHDTVSIRSGVSSFWGPTLQSGGDNAATSFEFSKQSIQLALPLPQLTAEVFESSGSGMLVDSPVQSADPGARAAHQYTKNREIKEDTDDGIFVIRQLGKAAKRKREKDTEEQTRTDLGGSAGDVSQDADKEQLSDGEVDSPRLTEPVPSKTLDKAARKAARKERKRLEKEAEARGAAALEKGKEQSAGDEEPFDYSKAASVLNSQERGGKPSKSSFAPYQKSMNAPQGLRKVQKEKSGKSFTFRQ